MLELTIQSGIPIDNLNAEGMSPMHFAVAAGKIDAVRTLLAHGATVDIPDGVGANTPLMTAAKYGHAGTVQCSK